MKLPWQQATWEGSIKANIALSISNTVAIVIALVAVLYAYSIKQMVVFTPPVIDQKMSISWDSANEAYLKSWGLYTAELIGNITSQNAPMVADAISQFVDPGVYPDIRKAILSASETSAFKDAAMATKFSPEKMLYEADTHKVFVSGSMLVVSTAGAQPPQPITYEMVLRIVERRPVVYAITSYPGMQAHTEAWLKDHAMDEQK